MRVALPSEINPDHFQYPVSCALAALLINHRAVLVRAHADRPRAIGETPFHIVHQRHADPGSARDGDEAPSCSASPMARSFPSSAEPPSRSGVRDGYSWIAKLGMQAAICRHAAVLTGDSGLCGTIQASCASAIAAIFFAPVMPPQRHTSGRRYCTALRVSRVWNW